MVAGFDSCSWQTEIDFATLIARFEKMLNWSSANGIRRTYVQKDGMMEVGLRCERKRNTLTCRVIAFTDPFMRDCSSSVVPFDGS